MTQKNLNVRRGDKVVVITGKDAGKQGVVLAAYPKTNRIVVEGVNIISRHTKPRSAQDKGGIIKKEGTIDVSNVMIVCATCGKPTRISNKIVDGKSVRVCKCGSVIERKYEKVAKKKEAKQDKKQKPTAEEKNTKINQKLKKSKSAPKTVKNKAETAILKRKQEMQ
jgi:large subunit ribosomal protein L24